MHSVKILGERKASFGQFFGAKGNLKCKCKKAQPIMKCRFKKKFMKINLFLEYCFLT